MKRGTRLWFKIVLFQVVIITGIMLIFGVFSFFRSNIALKNQIESEGDYIGRRLSDGLVTPIWKNDTSEVQNLIGLEMMNRNVLAIILDQDDQKSGKMRSDDYSDVLSLREYIEQAGEEALAQRLNTAHVFSNGINSNVKVISKDGKSIGILYVYFTDSYINQTLMVEIGIIIVQILVLIVILAISTSLVLRAFMGKPFDHISSRINEIATGEADLTQKLNITTRDEIGRFSAGFNRFVDNLNEIMIATKSVSETMLNIKSSLGVSAEETSSAIVEITANIEGIKKQLIHLDESITASSSAVDMIRNTIESQNIQVVEQSSAVEESSASVNQMVASLNNVAKITRAKKLSTEKLVETTTRGGEKLLATSRAVQEINSNVDSIGEMVRLINKIASQTNLLAMNAAIEAAHAGEAGKGFSVVADEIRKLAETSGENAGKISKVLKQVIGQIQIASVTSDETRGVFQEIDREVKDVTNAFTEILSAASELSVGGGLILQAMQVLNDISMKVKSASGEMSDGAVTMTRTMETAAMISSEVRSSMEEITSGIRGISSAMNSVTDLTVELGGNADTMYGYISKFKTG